MGSTKPVQQRQEGGAGQGGREESVRSGPIRGIFCRSPWAGSATGNEANCERDKEAMGFGLRTQTSGTVIPEMREGCRKGRPGEERKDLEFGFENIKSEMLIRHSDEDAK